MKPLFCNSHLRLLIKPVALMIRHPQWPHYLNPIHRDNEWSGTPFSLMETMVFLQKIALFLNPLSLAWILPGLCCIYTVWGWEIGCFALSVEDDANDCFILQSVLSDSHYDISSEDRSCNSWMCDCHFIWYLFCHRMWWCTYVRVTLSWTS